MMYRDLPNEVMAIMTLCSAKQKAQAFMAAELSAEHFADGRTKEIFSFFMALTKSRHELPTHHTLQHATQLSSEAKELLDEGSYPPAKTKGDAEQIVAVLEKLRQGRVILQTFEDVMEVMSPDDGDPADAFALIEKGLLEARASAKQEALHISAEGNLEPTVEEILSRTKPDAIPTGFRDFDAAAGGLPRGGLTTIAASSGGGKSCMASQIALNAFWEGYSIVIVTLEMSKAQVTGRLMANQSGVSYSDIHLGKTNPMQKERIRKTRKKMDDFAEKTGNRLDVFPMSETTISEIALQFRALSYDIIIIDYINLLNRDDDGNNEAQFLTSVSREAKNQAGATNSAWVILAQLNEQGQVKYSRGIAENSDYLLSWTYGDAERESHIIEVSQQKSRNSESFKFNLRENFKIQAFENIGNKDQNADVAVRKSGKKKKDRLTTAAPMPGMRFEDEDDDDL